MYSLIHPLLRRLDPEIVRALAPIALRLWDKLPGKLKRTPSAVPVTRMGLTFPNPLGVAAGLDKDGESVKALSGLGFGFVEVGTVTPRAQPGNPRPRLFLLPAAKALINRMGFNNKGCEQLAVNLERARSAGYSGVIGVNIGKNRATPLANAADDYLYCFQYLADLASYFVVNVSSPNTPALRELQAPQQLRVILERLLNYREQHRQTAAKVPILVKVSPDLSLDGIQAITTTIRALDIAGVIATNTTTDKTAVVALPYGGESGGLSGAPLQQRTLAAIRHFREQLTPGHVIIGAGGIMDAADAARYITAGADLIQIYTGLIYAGPGLVRRIVVRLQEEPVVRQGRH